MNTDILSKNGLIVMSEYNGKYVYCQDRNGYIGKFYLRDIKNKRYTVTRLADESNPYSIHNIKQFLKNIQSDIVLLSDNYKNNKQKLKWKCSCGEIFELSWQSFQHRPRKTCSLCSRNRVGVEHYSLEYVKNECLKRGLEKIDDEYVDSKTPFLVRNKEGYLDEKCFTSIMQNKTHIKFDVNNKYFYDNIRHWFYVNNYNCDIIEDSYHSNKEKMKFKCECGKVYECLISSILYNNTPSVRCPVCSRSLSNNELKIKHYLENKKIKYKQQYKYPDCKLVKPLPFDFYLPDKNILIEIDGEQHYKQKFNMTEDEFDKVKIRDKIKDEYCKNNNITLIRIPYWYMYNKKYKNILDNFLI